MSTERTIGLEDLRRTMGEVVGQVRHTQIRVTVTKNNKPVAMLISVEHYRALTSQAEGVAE